MATITAITSETDTNVTGIDTKIIPHYFFFVPFFLLFLLYLPQTVMIVVMVVVADGDWDVFNRHEGNPKRQLQKEQKTEKKARFKVLQNVSSLIQFSFFSSHSFPLLCFFPTCISLNCFVKLVIILVVWGRFQFCRCKEKHLSGKKGKRVTSDGGGVASSSFIR